MRGLWSFRARKSDSLFSPAAAARVPRRQRVLRPRHAEGPLQEGLRLQRVLRARHVGGSVQEEQEEDQAQAQRAQHGEVSGAGAVFGAGQGSGRGASSGGGVKAGGEPYTKSGGVLRKWCSALPERCGSCATRPRNPCLVGSRVAVLGPGTGWVVKRAHGLGNQEGPRGGCPPCLQRHYF